MIAWLPGELLSFSPLSRNALLVNDLNATDCMLVNMTMKKGEIVRRMILLYKSQSNDLDNIIYTLYRNSHVHILQVLNIGSKQRCHTLDQE